MIYRKSLVFLLFLVSNIVSVGGLVAPYRFQRIPRAHACERVTEFMILHGTVGRLWEVYLSFLLDDQLTKGCAHYAAMSETSVESVDPIPPHQPWWVAAIDIPGGDGDGDGDDEPPGGTYEVQALIPHPFLNPESHGPWANCSRALDALQETLGGYHLQVDRDQWTDV